MVVRRPPSYPGVSANLAWRRRLRQRVTEYAFVLPALLLLLAIVAYPMFTALHLSLSDVTLVPPSEASMGFATRFTGVENYLEVVQSPDFWGAMNRTAFFTLFTIAGTLVLGMAFALALDSSIKARSLWRIAMLTPWVVAPVVAGGTWRWIFDTRYGILNDLLHSLFPQAQPVLWLANPTLALVAVSVTNVWLRTPFMVVMILAGLQAIPIEQYEAAAVDGASAWRRFLYITLPNLRFIMVIATLLEGIWTFKHFDIVHVMTGGGPGRATEILSLLIYKTSFQFFRFGPAAAMGVLMAIMLIGFTMVYLRLIRPVD